MKRLIKAAIFLSVFCFSTTAFAQTAPSISDLDYPALTTIFDQVIVTATITDPEGLPSVLPIHGTIEVPDLLPGVVINIDDYVAYFSPQFYDDGTHGDAVAGDGVYTFALDLGQLIEDFGVPAELLELFTTVTLDVDMYVEDAEGNDSNTVAVISTFYNPSPTISNLVYPELINLNDTLTISMQITDPDDDLPACIQLFGDFSSPDFPELGLIDFTAAGLTIFICDDGGPGDAFAGDGIYTVQVDLFEAIGEGNLPPEFLPYLESDFTLDANFWVFDLEGYQSNTVSGQAAVGQDNLLGPHISNLVFPPDVLTTDTITTVSMDITDEQGDIPAVIQAWVSVTSPTFANVSAVLVDVILYDDGTNGDVTAGDGTYTRSADLSAAIAANLPPGFEAYMTEGIVNGEVWVEDLAGHRSNVLTASAHFTNPTVHRPVISEFTFPAFLLASDTVMATARITDEDGDITSGCILIHASGTSPTFPNLGTIYTDDFLALFTIHMCDDGRQGDVTPGDGIYTITENPSDHLASVPVEYQPYLTDFLANGEWWVFDDAGHQSNVVTATVHFYNDDAARPVISNLTFPASIGTLDTVQITAAISDANGDLDPCLRVHGNLSSPSFPGVVISYEDYDTYICDDGTQGDAIAGDGIYTYQENMTEVLSWVDPALIDLIGSGGDLSGEMWIFDQAGHQSNVATANAEIFNPDSDAPVIGTFSFPTSAGPEDTVTITAAISDANGDLPACVDVHGSVFSPTYPNLGVIDLDSLASFQLCDNGSMGDAVAGDGIFTHVISVALIISYLPPQYEPFLTDGVVTVNWWVFDLAGHQSNTVIGTISYADDTAHRPEISDTVFPTFVLTDDVILISARITDVDGDLPPDMIVMNALASSPTFSNLGELPLDFDLFDNGTNGDAVAHDGIYSQRLYMATDVMPYVPVALLPYLTDLELQMSGWVFDLAGHQSNVVSGSARLVNPEEARPIISDVSFPANVEADDVVSITARIVDADNDLSACLLMHGLVNSPTFPEVGVIDLDDLYPFVEIELCDDGLLGDAVAGDGIYTVERSIQEVMSLVPAPYLQYMTDFNAGLQWWVFDDAGHQSNVVSASSHFYNTNPVIASLTAPASAGPTDTIFIAAHIVDADGDLPAQIQMLGTVTSPTWPELGTVGLDAFGIPILLYDDGTNGDVTAGDGIYSRLQPIAETLAYMPSIFLPFISDGTTIALEIYVEDLAGHASNVWSTSASYVDPNNHAPVMSDPVFPVSADSDDIFMLSVRITDEDGDLPTESITVNASGSSPDYPALGSFPIAFTLYDNATMGDAVAHDGIYSQRIYAATDLMPFIPEALRPYVSEITVDAEGWVFDLAGHKSNTITGTASFVNLDDDFDGVLDTVETASGCMDPNNPDTDGDGLADGVEDADQDGVVDALETSPCLADTDGDASDDATDLCALDTNNWAAGCAACVDGDGDSFFVDCDRYATISGPDCDDGELTTFPGAPEICDGLDNDCDTVADNGLTFTEYFTDLDGDDYGVGSMGSFCSVPADSALVSGDCNDGDPNVNPGEAEVCDDGIDNNCADGIDENCGVSDWDYDGDGLPDAFETANLSGHTLGMNLDPYNALDGLMDFDGDGISNADDYWNAGGADGLGGVGISGSGVYVADKVGWPACGYWADGDGDGFVAPADISVVSSAIKGSPDFSATYPPNGETLDLDTDTFISPADISILGQMIKNQVLDPLNSRPVAIARVTPATGVTPSGLEGDVISVTVSVTNTASSPASGIPIIFSIDPSSTGAATILGGEGEDVASTRYDLTTDVASGAQARVTVLLTGTGTVVINAKVAECGTGGVGRYCAEVTLAEPVVVTVGP